MHAACSAPRSAGKPSTRFHWILSRDDVRRLVDAVPDEEGARNLWGYVDLDDATRACLLALAPRDRGDRYQALLIVADDTRIESPIEGLIASYYPDSDLRADITGTTGAFDCSRARDVIGWTARSRWREDL